MNISLHNAGKRYNREWVFRHLHYEFVKGKKYAITGFNGSGKSTLLLVIAGAVVYNEGKVNYYEDETAPSKNEITEPYRHISIAAPYLEMIEEMDSTELLNFHSTFKTLSKPIEEILEIAGLQNAAHKQVRYYSSGMKQRLKLVHAFFSCTPVLLLDEPTTNLDEDGVNLYNELITNHCDQRLVIISSNVQQEYDCCEEVIKMEKYK